MLIKTLMVRRSIYGELKKTFFMRFIGGVERVGNKLPHPFIMFCWLILFTIVASVIAEVMGAAVTYTKIVAGGASEIVTVKAVSLLSRESVRYMFENYQHIYFDFTPLRAVFPLLMAIGVTEQSGLLDAFIKKTLMKAPEWAVMAILSCVALNANLASDAGIIAAATVGGAIYKAKGKNPWIGIALAYAAGNAGFGANFLIASQDLVVNGITAAVANEIGINAPTHVLMNWYFLASAVIILTIVSVWVTKRFTVRHIVADGLPVDIPRENELEGLNEDQNKGLHWAGITLLIWVAFLLALIIPSDALLRSNAGNILPQSPLLNSIIFILFLSFLFPSIAYGVAAGTIKSSKDIPGMMSTAAKQNSVFLVIAMTASIFIKLFNMSNLPTIIGFAGGALIKAANLAGYPTLVIIVMITSFVNLFIASANAKWMMLAPIYIPMFCSLGFSPALVTAAYRAGDSSTNPLAPLSYMLVIALALFERYNVDPEGKPVGVGTVMSYALPYTVFFMLAFLCMLAVFYFFNLQLGPGVSPFL